MPSPVTSKGQVTIPKNIRDWLKIRPNDRGDFAKERLRAKAAVGRRVREETA